MAAQARFYMRDRQFGPESGERAAQRTRRVALDDEQVGAIMERSKYSFGNILDVTVRVSRAGAMQLRGRALAEPVIRRIEAGMLSGEDQRGLQVECRQGSGDGRELDRLGPCADDQPDIRATQISP